MKNILYTATLIVLPLLSIAQTELKINADFRGRNCSGGLGLCSIYTTSEVQKNNQEYKTTAFKLDETTIVLEFNKTFLSEEDQISLLNTTLKQITAAQSIEFIQEEDVFIDIEILKILGIASKYNTIKKGHYPLVINIDTIQVTLKLWEQ